jgi:hypothetical protein
MAKVTDGRQLMNDAVPLECHGCGKTIGFVWEFDLNGSYFYCIECKAKADADQMTLEPSPCQSSTL